MIGSIWNFVKRHKKKFIFLGTVTGGSWLLYKYAVQKMKELRDEADKQYLVLIRRQHHFESNQRTCNMTVLAMVLNVRDILTKTLDTEAIKEMLKSSPANKLDLWEELKIMSMTRSLASVYGICMLSVMLRVQMNMMGGYLYLDSLPPPPQKTENGENSRIPQRVQEKYLALVKQFLERGFPDFVNYLRLAVTKEIGALHLKELISLDQLSAVMSHIRERVECGVNKPTQSLNPYLLASEQVPDVTRTSQLNAEDELLEKLIAETRDIFESDDFHTVLKSSLDRGFNYLLDGVAEHYKQQIGQGDPKAGIHSVSIAMAKLIPVINSLMFTFCADAPNTFVQELLLMDDLKQLAANVYEAFSQEQSEKII